MRKFLLATALVTAALSGASLLSRPAQAQTQTAALSQADRDFYFAVLRAHALNAPNGVATPWSREGRSGTVTFTSVPASRASDDCFTYFLRETAPLAKTPISGSLCTRSDRMTGFPGGNPEVAERGTIYELERMQPAPAAGPGGEPTGGSGGSRGIVLPAPERPSPPPAPQPPPVVSTPSPSAAKERPRSVQPSAPRPGVVRRGTTAGATPQVNIKPVLVQIGKRTARANQNGGHAVVLLASTAQVSARNLALCEALLRNFDDAPLADILVGVRREADGTISALRAIYWPVDDTRAVTGDSCAQRLRRYDYTRAATIRDKHRLTGPGPYLLVSRNDEQQAAAINLAGMAPADIDKATLYFRDAFSQKGNIWNPQGFNRQREEQTLIARWGAGFSRALVSAVEFYSGGPANAAAPARACIGDLTDTRRC